MSDPYESVTDLGVIPAPWSKELTLQEMIYEGGFPMIRLRIRERKRFTDLELDADTARALVDAVQSWLAKS